MNSLTARISAVLAVATLTASMAIASPDKGKKVAALPKCPVCRMELATKKSAANPTLVKIGSKTYYCCDKCPMGAHKGGDHKAGHKGGGKK